MKTQIAFNRVKDLLFARRDVATGAWTGRLSSSALSTALAVTALEDGSEDDRRLARRGAQWLVDRVNGDGGWGDTPRSPSNISTSLIARAGISRHPECMGVKSALTASGAWILAETGGLGVAAVADTLRRIYGDDKTFAVPILMYLAICNGKDEQWTDVPAIPFYLALLPGWCFRFLRLEVVSYALPALIAVGLCRHIRASAARGARPWGRWIAKPLLAKLRSIQPEHGGFLDAVPLTAFVVLALKACGYGDCGIVRSGVDFLRESVLDDGSWPIDTNLRCWLTSLAARVLSDDLKTQPDSFRKTACWLLDCQHRSVHPYTGARPGGWAWTDLPGGVPDADDTSAALIALYHLKEGVDGEVLAKSVRSGLKWLLELRNRDGGVPTFCRGWGRLPFDCSCCDITAHAVEAMALWRGFALSSAGDVSFLDARSVARLGSALTGMIGYLKGAQRQDGSWLPLWFGHQESKGRLNPIIGTARVLSSLHTLATADSPEDDAYLRDVREMIQQGESYLLSEQKPDGGWSAGRDSTIEETALAVAALAPEGGSGREAAVRGGGWLADMVMNNEMVSAPVGLYFSALWYDERLYPLIWSAGAFRALGCG